MRKFLPYIIILIILAGLFGSAGNARAQAVPTNQNYLDCVNAKPPWGTPAECATRNPDKIPAPTGTPTNQNYKNCIANNLGTPAQCATTNPDTAASLAVAPQTEFQRQATQIACNLTPIGDGTVGGCIVQVSYVIFYQFAAIILALMAKFFNAIIALTVNSTLYTKSSFIPTAWAVTRDLSNIFFILVLLYIAIRMILDIGGSDAKKMIVRVIIMALLINFSMFFTQVVIDSSNMLALVFYNKLDVNTKNADGSQRPYDGATGSGEKDISGAVTNSFNPTSALTWGNFFKAARDPVALGLGTGTPDEKGKCTLLGVPKGGLIGALYTRAECGSPQTWTSVTTNPDGSLVNVPTGIMLGLILVSGLVMFFAAYAFFIAGISFVGRLIELWILIVFSPFAFMSSTIPILNDIEYIGWKAWLHRLLTVAFMAPIFMFFLYFIFLLLKPPGLFGGLITGTGMLETLLLFFIPAMIILILLLKATDFAKKGSGKLGEMLIKGTEIAMGAAAGVTLGVVAKGAQMTVGQASSRMANSEWAKKREAEGKFGGALFRKTTQGLAKSSFDVRQGAVGGVLAAAGGISGLNLGHGSKLFKEAGGFEADKKKKIENRQRRAEDLKVGPDEQLTQGLRQAEGAHQELLTRHGSGAHEIQLLDNRIKILGDRSNIASRDSKLVSSKVPGGTEGSAINSATGNTFAEDARLARNALADAQGERGAIKNATMFRTSDGRIVDHRDATTNNNLSEDAISGIINTQRAADLAAQAAPGNVTLSNASAITTAARDAALAARDVTLRAQETAANYNLAQNPLDANLIRAAAEATAAAANANVATSTANANQSAAIVAALAQNNPTDDTLVHANQSATDALNRIANGTTGRSINNLEDTDIPATRHLVDTESKARARNYADVVQTGVLQSISFLYAGGQRAQAEAAHNIRMGAKLDSGTGGKGGGH